MNEDYKSDFRIRIDEDEPSRSFLHPEIENQQIDKLRRRITVMSVFTICLLALALTYAYIDIKKQMGIFSVGGSRGFETLSQDVESRFSSLSVKYAELEDKFANRISVLEKSVLSMKTGLDKTTATLNKSLESVKKKLKRLQSSTVDQKTLSSLKRETDTEVTALQKDMENFSSMLQNMDSEYAGALTEFQKNLESAGKRLSDFQDSLSELVAVSARKPTKEEINAGLRAKSLDFQDKVDELTTLLNRNDDKIESLSVRIEALKKDFTEIAGRPPDLPAPALKQMPSPSENKLFDDSATINDGVKELDIQ